jgi:hypothetical protein
MVLFYRGDTVIDTMTDEEDILHGLRHQPSGSFNVWLGGAREWRNGPLASARKLTASSRAATSQALSGFQGAMTQVIRQRRASARHN